MRLCTCSLCICSLSPERTHLISAFGSVKLSLTLLGKLRWSDLPQYLMYAFINEGMILFVYTYPRLSILLDLQFG